MIQDIIDLRTGGWVLRREIETVKTKDEIRLAYQKEQQQKNQPKRNKRYDHHDRRNDNRGQDVRNTNQRKHIATVRQTGTGGRAWGKPSPQKNNATQQKQKPGSRNSQDVRGARYSNTSSPTVNSTQQRQRSSPPKSQPKKQGPTKDDLKKKFKAIADEGKDKELPDAKLDQFLQEHKTPQNVAKMAYGVFFDYYLCCCTKTQKQMLTSFVYHNREDNLNQNALKEWLADFAGMIGEFKDNSDCPHVSKYYARIVGELVVTEKISVPTAFEYLPRATSDNFEEDQINMFLIGLLKTLIEGNKSPLVQKYSQLFAENFKLSPKVYNRPSRRTCIPDPAKPTQEDEEIIPVLQGILGEDYYSKVKLAESPKRRTERR